ncbi:MAG: permease prefix domain 1-containing protein [Bacillota bacterium]
MKQIDDFVKKIVKHHPSADEETTENLKAFLNEKVEDLMEQGYEEDDAVKKTIEEFGEPEEFYLPNLEKDKKRYFQKEALRRSKNALLFSFLSSLLIIAILMVVNFVFFPDIGPWSIIAALGVLFWPLSVLYRLLNRKGD